MASFSKFLESFNDDNSKGKQFEEFVKWFLENDPEWQTQVDKVWLWDKYPKRWGRDDGIDLIFRHKNGETWAVQAKCYDQKYAVTKKDMDSFLSESSRPEIDRRLLMASTDNIGPKVKKLCLAQEKPVTLFKHSDFTKSQIEYPEHIKDLKKAKRKELPKPRDHQAAAIKDVVKGFKTEDRGQMIMACGTGKTFTTLWIKEKLKPKTSLVLLPSLSLLSQTLREWTGAATKPFEALCVCSDASVGKASDDELSESLADVSFPTTSNPEEITKFLERDVDKVIFSTYHSSPQVAEAHKINKELEFDLIISDEAHRSTGEAGKAFTTALDNNLIRSKKRLFTTATPRTYAPHLKKRASESGVEIADMSDESIFGRVFHNLTFGQAIESELLTDYQVVIIGINESMIAEWIENRELVRYEGGEITDAKSLAAQVGVVKAIKDYDINRIITFHSTVKKAKSFSEKFKNAVQFVAKVNRPDGNFYTEFVSGKMTSFERNLKLSQLKELPDADRGILTNARCLSEGVDVPSLDGVAFIDPKSSQVDIVQAVGRAIRKSENKTKGTIILPVFIEEGENDAEEIEKSRFKHIWQVINALKSHDETLSFQLDQLRTNLGYQGEGYVLDIPDKIVFDMPREVDEDFSKSLKTLLVNVTTQSWDFWYGLLSRFYEENGHSRVKQNTIVDGSNLGNWVGTQRKDKTNNKLSENQINKLEKLNFIWDVNELSWQEGYKYLLEHIEEKGHTLVKSRSLFNGYNLASWVQNQRNYKKNGTLEKDREEKLNNVDFVWDVSEYQSDIAYEKLVIFYNREGHINVPAKHYEDGFYLGKWLSHQRSHYKDCTLEDKKIELLNNLGMIWNTQEAKWNDGFNSFKDYLLENKTPLIKQKALFKGYKLGHWVSVQRERYKAKLLKPKYVDLLNQLGFVWNEREYLWNIGYEYYLDYLKNGGDLYIKQNFIYQEYELGKWVRRQKTAIKSNQLSESNIEKLNALGFIWNNFDEKWQRGFEIAQKYFDEFGNLDIKQKDKYLNFELGHWIAKQKYAERNNKLDRTKKIKLEALGIVWRE